MEGLGDTSKVTGNMLHSQKFNTDLLIQCLSHNPIQSYFFLVSQKSRF